MKIIKVKKFLIYFVVLNITTLKVTSQSLCSAYATPSQSVICSGQSTTLTASMLSTPVITTFSTVGSTSWTAPTGVTSVTVLVVAGGGSGGVDNGGGGGGGGVIYNTNFAVTPGSSYPITVGAGGAARPGSSNDGPGNNGGNSSAFGLTAIGGSGGTGWVNTSLPPGSATYTGGSGAGQSTSNGAVNSVGAGVPIFGQGYAGGIAISGYAGGGGGAGGAGGNASPGNVGAGGEGLNVGAIFGFSIGVNGYVGGGGAGGFDIPNGFSSSLPFTRNGTVKKLTQTAEDPCPNNTGAGGNGTNHDNQTSGAGGSGIVIIKYAGPALGGVTYSWSNGATTSSIVVSPTVNTTYSVVATSTTGCISNATVLVGVNNPTLNLTGTSIVCSGSSATLSPLASGGGAPVIVTFTTTGASTWTVPSGVNSLSVTVVGGGGGGGGDVGGGGGGGQVINLSNYLVIPGQVLNLNVASQTAYPGGYNWFGQNGGSTILYGGSGGTITAIGGNGGRGRGGGGAGANVGWNGGGGSYDYNTGNLGNGGFAGGNAWPGNSCGGGAGSGGVGQNATSISPGAGGNGVASIIDGIFYGGGGGGGQYPGSIVGLGTHGGGNGGTTNSPFANGQDALPNRGSGGGGGPSTGSTNNAGRGSSGIIIISYSGVSSPIGSYLWSNGATTASIIVTPTVNTNYSVSVTPSVGCVSNSNIFTVSVTALPSVAVNSGSICSGKSFTMSASGATTYTYSSGTAIVSPTTNTSYTVTGTSSVGCINTAIATVTVNANPTVTVNSGAICNGSSFTMSPTGASTYTYSSGSSVVSPITNSSYNVTGTSALGCVSSNTAVSIVTVNANPTVAVNSGAICNGSSFTMNPSGALTYVYSSGAALVSPSITTTYSVTGNNAAGCTNTALSTVTVNAIPTIVIPPTGVCTGGTATLTPTGASTYTYSGGSAIVTPPSNTTYTITGTSAAGCIGSAVTTVSVSGSLVFAVNSGSICTGKSFTMTPSGAATYTYSSGSPVVSPTTNTTYTVTGASAAGCLGTAIASVTVNVNPTVAVNSGSICNGSSFIMNPTGAATYVYTGGSATVSPTTNTNYTVTGTSALGCTNTAVSNVTVNANPVLTVNSGSLCSGNNFTFTPTGAISFTYSSGSAVVTPTATTDYTVTGSNVFGCTSSSVKTITVSITPVINVSSGAVCTGGSWTITPTGAATYTYSSGSAVVTPTAATTDYTVSGSNIDGCQSLAVITITVNPTLLFSPNSGSVCIGSTFTMSPTGALSYTYSSGTALVTPTTTTTYTIIAVNSVGCLGEDYCTVTVNALPTLTVNSGAICTGQSFTIVPTGASTYTYSSGSDVVNPLATTDYSITGTDANGCVTATDAISTVTVNALPTVTAATDFTLICVGEVATLSAGGASTYVWNTSATTSSTSVTPTTTTNYSVDGTDGNGCVNTANVTVNVNDCVGIQQLSSAKLNVNVYPNPTTGLVTLDLNATTQVTVTNALGQVVLTETVLAGKQTINLKNQNNGLYFMNLNQDGKQQTIKVIKN